ncbi:MAG: hypothetical protein KF688_00870 [Pirellulales bacterium]|nr:hypothetical protein [Pirellulales bacterium]
MNGLFEEPEGGASSLVAGGRDGPDAFGPPLAGVVAGSSRQLAILGRKAEPPLHRVVRRLCTGSARRPSSWDAAKAALAFCTTVANSPVLIGEQRRQARADQAPVHGLARQRRSFDAAARLMPVQRRTMLDDVVQLSWSRSSTCCTTRNGSRGCQPWTGFDHSPVQVRSICSAETAPTDAPAQPAEAPAVRNSDTLPVAIP